MLNSISGVQAISNTGGVSQSVEIQQEIARMRQALLAAERKLTKARTQAADGTVESQQNLQEAKAEYSLAQAALISAEVSLKKNRQTEQQANQTAVANQAQASNQIAETNQTQASNQITASNPTQASNQTGANNQGQASTINGGRILDILA
jgi:hypothetical protein